MGLSLGLPCRWQEPNCWGRHLPPPRGHTSSRKPAVGEEPPPQLRHFSWRPEPRLNHDAERLLLIQSF